MNNSPVLSIPPQVRADERASLRRIDWRFLLPPPPAGGHGHVVLLGGSEAVVERIRETGYARQVSVTLPQHHTADVVAVLHTARVPLKQIAACLRPGGLLYYEVNRGTWRSLWDTPARVQRNLQAMGLSTLGMYAARPHFDACELYLPLHVGGALRWFVTSLYLAASPMQRLLESVLRISTGLDSRRFARMAPFYAVVASVGPVPSATASVLEHANIPIDDQKSLYPLVLTDAGNRVTVLPFEQEGTQPLVVLKVPKLPNFNNRTENEQATLTQVHAQLDLTTRHQIPQPLGIFTYGDITVSMESYVPGRSLSSSSGRWGIPLHRKLEDLRLAAAWLADFHLQARLGHAAWDETEIYQWIEAPLNDYGTVFSITASEERLFAAMRERATTLIGASFPVVCQHRDYNVWNIFRVGQKIAVIDWEGGQPGPALCDLIHFATHWNEASRHLQSQEQKLHAFRQLFCLPNQRDVRVTAIHIAFRQYMKRLEIDQRFFPLLLSYTWIELALRRYAQRRDMGAVGYDARADNIYFPLIDLLARHVDHLFEGDRHG